MSYTTEVIEVEKINKVSFFNKEKDYKIVYLVKAKNGIIYQYQSNNLSEEGVDLELELLEFIKEGETFKAIVLKKRSKLYKNKKINKIIKVLLEEDDHIDILKDFLNEDEN